MEIRVELYIFIKKNCKPFVYECWSFIPEGAISFLGSAIPFIHISEHDIYLLYDIGDIGRGMGNSSVCDGDSKILLRCGSLEPDVEDSCCSGRFTHFH